MGAWGIGAFENDDAADWLYELWAESSEQTWCSEIEVLRRRLQAVSE